MITVVFYILYCINPIQASTNLVTPALVVAPMILMMQQRTQTTCNAKLIAIFVCLEKCKGPIRLQGCEILSFHWIRETVQIEVILVRPHFHVNNL